MQAEIKLTHALTQRTTSCKERYTRMNTLIHRALWLTFPFPINHAATTRAAHTQTHAHIQARHTHTNVRTQTCAHKLTHAHTRTHGLKSKLFSSSFLSCDNLSTNISAHNESAFTCTINPVWTPLRRCSAKSNRRCILLEWRSQGKLEFYSLCINVYVVFICLWMCTFLLIKKDGG